MRQGVHERTDYRRLVDRIRDRIPNVSMTTDLIVGFCGETDKQFNRTYEMVRDVRFDKVHSAMYSTRDNTFASRKFEDDVPQDEKKRRLDGNRRGFRLPSRQRSTPSSWTRLWKSWSKGPSAGRCMDAAAAINWCM